MQRLNSATLVWFLVFSLTLLVPTSVLFAQQEATVEPVPIPAGKVLLSDDFSNPGSGWFVTETQFGRCGYDNGEYFVALVPTGVGVTFCSRREIARDFV